MSSTAIPPRDSRAESKRNMDGFLSIFLIPEPGAAAMKAEKKTVSFPSDTLPSNRTGLGTDRWTGRKIYSRTPCRLIHAYGSRCFRFHIKLQPCRHPIRCATNVFGNPIFCTILECRDGSKQCRKRVACNGRG